MASQEFEDRLAAAARAREARIASGEEAVRKYGKKLAFMTWGLSTQTAVSAKSAALAQRIMDALPEGRALETAGQPDTMPDAAWDSFRETLGVAESWAQRHVVAWRQMQEYAAAAGPERGAALVRGGGPVPEPASHLVRNLVIAGGVAGAIGVGYLIWRKRTQQKGGR